MRLANPIGLAAGFDKNAEVPDAMLQQGFGFVEVGSLTPLAQVGNDRPRMFRLTPDGAVINRLGFNNDGIAAAADRLRQRMRRGIVGVNIGANATSADRVGDYLIGLQKLGPLADYVMINVSSPNTVGLRGLQEKSSLLDLLKRLREARANLDHKLPMLLKIAPDLIDAELADIAEVALESDLDGLIISNTTIERPDSLVHRAKSQTGGLSGRPLFAPSTQVLARIHQLTEGRVPLIGVGGVASGADAFAKIQAGATLVQLYTALVYHGPGLVLRINRDLANLLRRNGFGGVSDAVGSGRDEILDNR